MKLELIIIGKIQFEKAQPEFSHHTEILQVESDNDQKVEFNPEESQSDLVPHNKVLQVESKNCFRKRSRS